MSSSNPSLVSSQDSNPLNFTNANLSPIPEEENRGRNPSPYDDFLQDNSSQPVNPSQPSVPMLTIHDEKKSSQGFQPVEMERRPPKSRSRSPTSQNRDSTLSRNITGSHGLDEEFMKSVGMGMKQMAEQIAQLTKAITQFQLQPKESAQDQRRSSYIPSKRYRPWQKNYLLKLANEMKQEQQKWREQNEMIRDLRAMIRMTLAQIKASKRASDRTDLYTNLSKQEVELEDRKSRLQRHKAQIQIYQKKCLVIRQYYRPYFKESEFVEVFGVSPEEFFKMYQIDDRENPLAEEEDKAVEESLNSSLHEIEREQIIDMDEEENTAGSDFEIEWLDPLSKESKANSREYKSELKNDSHTDFSRPYGRLPPRETGREVSLSLNTRVSGRDGMRVEPQISYVGSSSAPPERKYEKEEKEEKSAKEPLTLSQLDTSMSLEKEPEEFKRNLEADGISDMIPVAGRKRLFKARSETQSDIKGSSSVPQQSSINVEEYSEPLEIAGERERNRSKRTSRRKTDDPPDSSSSDSSDDDQERSESQRSRPLRKLSQAELKASIRMRDEMVRQDMNRLQVGAFRQPRNQNRLKSRNGVKLVRLSLRLMTLV